MGFAIVLLSLLGASPTNAIKRMTPVVFPPHSSEMVGVELGYGIADVAGSALYQSGAYHHLHLKQVLSLARRRGWTSAELAEAKMRDVATQQLGARRGAYGTLQKTSSGWRLSATVFRGDDTVSVEVDLPSDAAQVVARGGLAIAKAIAGLDTIALAEAEAHPRSDSGAAMSAYLSCYATLVRQPMGLRESHVVEADALTTARELCEKAVELDPSFVDAWSALSLASSLSLHSERAAAALEKARNTSAYVPFVELSEYWLATRFKSNAAGATVLRDAVRAHPGSLIFLSYLGEHLNITRQYREALAVWNRYVAAVTLSPYASSQKGYSLARLGLLDDALAVSREAAARDPENMVVELELASRLVDAEKLDEARALLERLVQRPHASGEAVLRLGYVYLLQRKHQIAQQTLERALSASTGPSEWRTRGRARYNLAVLMARRGELDAAENQLLAAAKEGFVVGAVLADDADLAKLRGRPRVAHLFENPDLELDPKFLQLSPFPIDAGGNLRPDAARPSAPGFRF